MTLKTRLHYYYFRFHEPAEAKAWSDLQEKLLGLGYGPRRFHTWGGENAPCKNETVEVEIETAFLFADQWNTAAPHNSRVFDWFQQYEINRTGIARGHWLEITPEMEKARKETLACGYCGQQYGPHHENHRHDIPADGFCDACLDSPYLKESNLDMLRLVPASDKWENRPPLSADEVASLMPRYILRQTTGTDSRANKKRLKERADLDSEWDKTVTDATTKRDGLIWIWDLGFSLDNVIFYSHTGVFCFGWRDGGVSPAVGDKVRRDLKDFPFKWEVRQQNGETFVSPDKAEDDDSDGEILAAVVGSGPVVKEGGQS